MIQINKYILHFEKYKSKTIKHTRQEHKYIGNNYVKYIGGYHCENYQKSF